MILPPKKRTSVMEIGKLRELCVKLGGALVEMTPEDFNKKFTGKGLRDPKGLYNAPFTNADLGVNYPKKQVLYSTRCGAIKWAEIIHEMGHVFASEVNPEKSDEWGFLGWEYATCLYIGGNIKVWKHYMKDYGLDYKTLGKEFGCYEFGGLTQAEQDEILSERLVYAKKAGLVAKDGTPLSVRKNGHKKAA